MRQRDDREDLIKEVQRLREKNTELEKERAKIQTQVRWGHSEREKDSACL